MLHIIYRYNAQVYIDIYMNLFLHGTAVLPRGRRSDVAILGTAGRLAAAGLLAPEKPRQAFLGRRISGFGWVSGGGFVVWDLGVLGFKV